MINLAPLAEEHPYLVSISDYNRLKNLQHQGEWSICFSELEWLVKLHFVRKMFKESKIDSVKFQATEKKLVIQWLSKIDRVER